MPICCLFNNPDSFRDIYEVRLNFFLSKKISKHCKIIVGSNRYLNDKKLT